MIRQRIRQVLRNANFWDSLWIGLAVVSLAYALWPTSKQEPTEEALMNAISRLEENNRHVAADLSYKLKNHRLEYKRDVVQIGEKYAKEGLKLNLEEIKFLREDISIIQKQLKDLHERLRQLREAPRE